MSDINFVEGDARKIEQDIIQQFEQALGETLYPADERRIFLQQLTSIIVGLKNSINDSARQNLLRYARGEVLDALGEFYGDRGKRLAAQKAVVTLRFTLSAVQAMDVVIPKGTRVTDDGKIYFATITELRIPAGQTTGDVSAEAADIGTQYNGYIAGQIKNIVDPVPYVASVTNIDPSAGGADTESDDDYRARLQLLPESFSTAGPEGAYIFWAKSADSTIADVAVDSPSAGVVRIVPLLVNGGIPDQAMLDKVLAATSAKDRRPLTDQVQVVAPTAVSYYINLTYYLEIDQKANETKYRQAIEGANLDCGAGSAIAQYVSWQQEKLGRAINPDQLRYFVQAAALYQSGDVTKTAVKRITLTEPVYTAITSIQVAKVATITVTYGGLE